MISFVKDGDKVIVTKSNGSRIAVNSYAKLEQFITNEDIITITLDDGYNMYIDWNEVASPLAGIAFASRAELFNILVSEFFSTDATLLELNDKFSNNMKGALNVTFPAENKSAFGDLIVVEPTPIIQCDFTTGLNTSLVKSTTTNGATVDTSNGRLRMQSGTNAAGSGVLQSIKSARYRAGQGMTARFTYAWENNAANNEHFVGVGSANDGYFFGYKGTEFGILHRNAYGTPTNLFIPQTEWNGDKCDGTGASEFNWDKTKGNVMMIPYPFLAFGPINFWVLHPTGEWILCHTIRYPNSSAQIQISSPNLYFYVFNTNSGNTTNVVGYGGSVGISLSGRRLFLGPKGSDDNNKAISAGTITNLFTIRNATTYNGKPNTSLIRINGISIASGNLGNNQFGKIFLIKNATLGGTPVYTPFDGSTTDNGITITNGNSVASIDKSGTTVTGGKKEKTFQAPQFSVCFIETTHMELYIAPGETYTFASDVTTNASMSASGDWVEDI